MSVVLSRLLSTSITLRSLGLWGKGARCASTVVRPVSKASDAMLNASGHEGYKPTTKAFDQ